MTTIAASETEIAWDSQETFGNHRAPIDREKVVIVKGTIYGCAGDSDACEALPAWHQRGAKIKSMPGGDWSMLVITKDVTRYYSNSSPSGCNVSRPIAIGSGGNFALAIMKDGGSAAKAVAVAAELDIYTGHPVKSMKIADVISHGKTKSKTKRVKKAPAKRKVKRR